MQYWGKRNNLERINPYVHPPLDGVFYWKGQVRRDENSQMGRNPKSLHENLVIVQKNTTVIDTWKKL